MSTSRFVDGDQVFYLRVRGDSRGFKNESGDYSFEDFRRESKDVQEATIAIAKIHSKSNPRLNIGDPRSSDTSFTFEQGMVALEQAYSQHFIHIRPYAALQDLAEAGIIEPAYRELPAGEGPNYIEEY